MPKRQREDDDEEGETSTRHQRARITVRPRILLSGRAAQEHAAVIVELGGVIVHSLDDCTHVVAHNPRRTKNIQGALATGKKVVLTTWVEQCSREGKFVDEANYILQGI